jgi:hypothetical protein
MPERQFEFIRIKRITRCPTACVLPTQGLSVMPCLRSDWSELTSA